MTGEKTSVRPDFAAFSVEAFPFWGLDWLKATSQVPVGFYSGLCREILGTTSRSLHEQADYLGKLSEVDLPADALACHREFTSRALAGWVDAGQRVFDESLAAFSPRK